jgi:hypothetical protein
MALPEVLCEPGKEGAPLILDHAGDYQSSEAPSDEDDFNSDDSMNDRENHHAGGDDGLTPADIDDEFERKNKEFFDQINVAASSDSQGSRVEIPDTFESQPSLPEEPVGRSDRSFMSNPSDEQLPPLPSFRGIGGLARSGDISSSGDERGILSFRGLGGDISSSGDERGIATSGRSGETSGRSSEADFPALSDERLKELLSVPLEPRPSRERRHRRAASAPVIERIQKPVEQPEDIPITPKKRGHHRTGSMGPVAAMRTRSDSVSSSRAGSPTEDRLMMRVTSFGEVSDHQPSLTEQARLRASSMHRRVPSLPRGGRHSRRNSDASPVSQARSHGGVAFEERHKRRDSDASAASSLALSQTERGGPSVASNEELSQIDARALWEAQGITGKKKL